MSDKVEPALFKFPGRGQKPVPVARIENVVFIVFKLPGRVAKKFAELGAETLTRLLGGDLTLADDARAAAAAQAELAASDPENPMRLFAQAVEARNGGGWKEARGKQLEAYKSCSDEIRDKGGRKHHYMSVNNRKNQAVMGFSSSTSQFKRKHGIKETTALWEYQDSLQLGGSQLFSEAMKRKLQGAERMSDKELETVIESTSALLKSTFAQLGMHDAPLVHHAKRIKEQEKRDKKTGSLQSAAAAPATISSSVVVAPAPAESQPQAKVRGGQIFISAFFSPAKAAQV